MGKSRNRAKSKRGEFWQSDVFNRRAEAKNLSMLLSLAMNRFRWVNLPNTCDERFLEMTLHRTGVATICHPDNMPDVWQSLIASPYGDFNAYGIPVRWRATGYDQTNYDVTSDNGELVYYSFSRSKSTRGNSRTTSAPRTSTCSISTSPWCSLHHRKRNSN